MSVCCNLEVTGSECMRLENVVDANVNVMVLPDLVEDDISQSLQCLRRRRFLLVYNALYKIVVSDA